MNLKKIFATALASTFLVVSASAAPDSKPKPKYKNNGKGAGFSNTKKVTCHGAWGPGALKSVKKDKGPRFPGT